MKIDLPTNGTPSVPYKPHLPEARSWVPLHPDFGTLSQPFSPSLKSLQSERSESQLMNIINDG